jgi:hypothetical protein
MMAAFTVASIAATPMIRAAANSTPRAITSMMVFAPSIHGLIADQAESGCAGLLRRFMNSRKCGIKGENSGLSLV